MQDREVRRLSGESVERPLLIHISVKSISELVIFFLINGDLFGKVNIKLSLIDLTLIDKHLCKDLDFSSR